MKARVLLLFHIYLRIILMIKAEVKVDDGNDDTELLSELVSLSNIEDGTVQIFIKFVLLVSFL